MNMNDTILDDELFRNVLSRCSHHYTTQQISDDTGIPCPTIYNYRGGQGMSVKKKQAIFKAIEEHYPEAFNRTLIFIEYAEKWEREKAEREEEALNLDY